MCVCVCGAVLFCVRQVSEEAAAKLVTKLFGKEVTSATRLDSYDDANFRIGVAGGETFTLKVFYAAHDGR